MEIKIKVEDSPKNESSYLTLTDENLDNDAFIEVYMGEAICTVRLAELMPAIIAFDAKRSRRLSEEEHML